MAAMTENNELMTRATIEAKRLAGAYANGSTDGDGYARLDPDYYADCRALPDVGGKGRAEAEILLAYLSDRAFTRSFDPFITYGDAAALVGKPGGARSLNHSGCLSILDDLCKERGWPLLSVLVVNSGTGLHSAPNWRGLHSPTELAGEVERVKHYFTSSAHLAERVAARKATEEAATVSDG